jgi:hypothetical protein
MSPDGDGVTAAWIRLPGRASTRQPACSILVPPGRRGMAEGCDTPHLPEGRGQPSRPSGRTRIAARSSEVRELGAASWCRKRESEPLSGLARDRGPLRGRARPRAGIFIRPVGSILERRGGHRSDRQSPSRADPVVGEYPGVTRRIGAAECEYRIRGVHNPLGRNRPGRRKPHSKTRDTSRRSGILHPGLRREYHREPALSVEAPVRTSERARRGRACEARLWSQAGRRVLL